MEVLRKNFEQEFENIEKVLREATFIAIDSEFSGLLASPENKTSLFDTASERYTKLKKNIEQFLIIQVGMTAFIFDREEYLFSAYTFTVPLFPRSCSSVDKKFLCQASSMEFLCHYNFNFNKFVYDGVPYLSYKNESQIREELQQGTLFRHLERTVSMDDEHRIQEQCSLVAEWIPNASIGDCFETTTETVNYQSGKLAEYLLLIELRRRFLTVWTSVKNGRVVVKKVSAEDRQALEADKDAETKHQEDLVNHFLGFSRIFKLLTELRKPIVGHNLLLDLMLMYNQFFEPLPKVYNIFKKNINLLFPIIYDTKYISFELKRFLGRDSMDSNALDKLFQFFKFGMGFNFTANSPKIVCAANYNTDQIQSRFHEAGWDSYCTGFCFIKLAFMNAEKQHGTLCMQTKSKRYTSVELMGAVSSMKNRVNVIRADISHISFDGPDPESERPKWLLAYAKDTLDCSEVAEVFAKYGAVDVKPHTRNKALVAVGNHKTYRDILNGFSSPGKFTVVRYNPLKHTWAGQLFLGGSFITCGSAAIWFLYKGIPSLSSR